MRREAALKSAFAAELKRQCPEFVTLFFSTAGAPDRGIVGHGRTSYWEFKHAAPSCDSKGDQELMCMRLDAQDFCRYVLWQEDSAGERKRTLIIQPKEWFGARKQKRRPIPEDSCVEFNQRWLVAYVRKVHS